MRKALWLHEFPFSCLLVLNKWLYNFLLTSARANYIFHESSVIFPDTKKEITFCSIERNSFFFPLPDFRYRLCRWWKWCSLEWFRWFLFFRCLSWHWCNLRSWKLSFPSFRWHRSHFWKCESWFPSFRCNINCRSSFYWFSCSWFILRSRILRECLFVFWHYSIVNSRGFLAVVRFLFLKDKSLIPRRNFIPLVFVLKMAMTVGFDTQQSMANWALLEYPRSSFTCLIFLMSILYL